MPNAQTWKNAFWYVWANVPGLCANRSEEHDSEQVVKDFITQKMRKNYKSEDDDDFVEQFAEQGAKIKEKKTMIDFIVEKVNDGNAIRKLQEARCFDDIPSVHLTDCLNALSRERMINSWFPVERGDSVVDVYAGVIQLKYDELNEPPLALSLAFCHEVGHLADLRLRQTVYSHEGMDVRGYRFHRALYPLFITKIPSPEAESFADCFGALFLQLCIGKTIEEVKAASLQIFPDGAFGGGHPRGEERRENIANALYGRNINMDLRFHELWASGQMV